MTDKIEDVFGDELPKNIEEWQFFGYKSKEEFEQAKKEQQKIEAEEEAEYQRKLHNDANEQLAIQQAIEDGTYYDQEQIQEEYNRQIIQEIERTNKEYLEFEQKKEFTFDDLVDKFAPVLIGLQGESYKHAIKMVFYSVLANQLKYNFFYAGGNKIDLRIPLLIMMKAGHGKKNIAKFIRKTIESLEYFDGMKKGLKKSYAEPTSYHPEQFVGKVIPIKDADGSILYNSIRGYFDSDYILIDEAYELLLEKDEKYKESLKYIRTALDTIGDNEVLKRQVGIPQENELKYIPNCTISLLTQPISEVNEQLLTRGSFRRFAIILVATPLEERIKAREGVELLLNTEEIDKKKWDIWIRNNQKLLQKKLQYITKKEDLILIDQYINKLIRNLKLDSSEEALEFISSIQFNIKYLIFKMAIVRAVIEQLSAQILNINTRHIELAIDDFDNIWKPQVSWIRKKMVIVSDKPIGWKDEVHGWILENLQKSDRLQKDVIEKYLEMNKGSFKDNTLKLYCNRALNDLKKWGMIKVDNTGIRNEKILKVK